MVDGREPFGPLDYASFSAPELPSVLTPEMQAFVSRHAPRSLGPFYEWSLTFPVLTIAGRARTILEAQVDLAFLPFRLRIEHDSAHKIRIRRFTKGSALLFGGHGGVPGDSFCERRPLEKRTPISVHEKAIAGVMYRLEVENRTDTALEVVAYLHGMTVRGGTP